MKQTVQTDPAAEVERLRELVLDLGEQVATLAATVSTQGRRLTEYEQLIRLAVSPLPEPDASDARIEAIHAAYALALGAPEQAGSRPAARKATLAQAPETGYQTAANVQARRSAMHAVGGQ
jgi:hypothetical protein